MRPAGAKHSGKNVRTAVGECWQYPDRVQIHRGLLLLGWRADHRFTSEDEAQITPAVETALRNSEGQNSEGHVFIIHYSAAYVASGPSPLRLGGHGGGGTPFLGEVTLVPAG